MRTLVLGGGSFVGPAVVDAALARGDEVTVFNRGQSDPPPSGVRHVLGDRTAAGCFAPLETEQFDLVVDTWSFTPRVVQSAADFFSSRAARYAYVSSISVYEEPYLRDFNEQAPVVEGDPGADATSYPADKRGAERAVERAFTPDRCVLARAGLIVGPKENTGRLLWWLRRIARGGTVLAPGPPTGHVQWIDARDLAAFLLNDRARGGAVTTTSPADHATFHDLMEACLTATGSDARVVWVTPSHLETHHVEPWTDMPLWLPPDGPLHPLLTADVSKAMALGLRCRAIGSTVADTWTWLHDVPELTLPPGLGLDAQREHDVLGALAADDDST